MGWNRFTPGCKCCVAGTGNTFCSCSNVPNTVTRTVDNYGPISTELMTFYGSASAAAAGGVPSGAYAGPAYYGATSAASSNSQATNLIICVNGGTVNRFMTTTTDATTGSLVSTTEFWRWPTVRCSPFLLSSGSGQNGAGNFVRSMTAS